MNLKSRPRADIEKRALNLSSDRRYPDGLPASQNDGSYNRPRATKIVATLGPASDSKEKIYALVEAGVNVFRLNFSHGTPDDHRQRANNAREAAQKLGKQVAIMADLQGPKIRVGKFEKGKIDLNVGDTFILDSDPKLGNQERVGLDFPDLAKDLHVGDVLLLNDGLIVLIVTSINGPQIVTRVKVGGVLSNNKGINRQGGGLSAPALTEKDKKDIVTAVSLNVEFIAVSFPKGAKDMQGARQLVDHEVSKLASGKKVFSPRLIAKIERTEAISALDEILEASDGIMVARGDLAVEVGNARVPSLQKNMIRRARAVNRIVITATQMMESMINYPMPTRAEVSDVANAVLDGTDAVMLSAETAAGSYPVETVTSMAQICIEAECSQAIGLDRGLVEQTFSFTDQAIAMGALFNAFHLDAKAIVALTESGATALWMSRHRSRVPIFALTPNAGAAAMMSAFHNVTPILTETLDDSEQALKNAIALLLERGYVNQGDLIVTTYGAKMRVPGGSNMMRIINVGSL